MRKQCVPGISSGGRGLGTRLQPYCPIILVGVQMLMGRALKYVKSENIQVDFLHSWHKVNLEAYIFSQLVRMVLSGCLEEHWLMKDEWRCAKVDSGELCVMIFGDLQMLVWYAGSLVTQDTVRECLLELHPKNICNWASPHQLSAGV